MSALIKQQYPLAVLKLCLDRSELGRDQSNRRGYTVFNLEVARESKLQIKVDTGNLGLPPTLRDARNFTYRDPNFKVPEDVVLAIPQWIEPGAPLWLELAEPCGNLALVPWERLLQPQLNGPLLRLPYFALQPVASPGRLDVVLCASAPAAKMPFLQPELLETYVQRILDGVHRNILIHIFADAAIYPELRGKFAGRNSSVRLYDPGEASRYEPAERSETFREAAGRLDNPWLRWISDKLDRHSIDMVHFICHGYLGPGQGALALAESPTQNQDPSSAWFVGPEQLSSFLNQLGAWSLAISSPLHNFSSMGLRLLADQVARLRPGPLLLHEADHDQDGNALGEAYRFLYNSPAVAPPPPISPALALYCHPNHVASLAPDQTGPTVQTLNEYTLATKAGHIWQGNANAPAWIASSQRFLEQTVAQHLEQEPESEGERVTNEYVKDALRYLSDVIARHTGPSGGGPSAV